MISFDNFTWTDGSPIYQQIIRHIKQGIAAGNIKDQEEMPSRRVLSALLGVNPNTVQKAYRILEEEGVVVSRAGAKSYICADQRIMERIRWELLKGDTKLWVEAMKRLNVTKEAAFEAAEELWKEAEGKN